MKTTPACGLLLGLCCVMGSLSALAAEQQDGEADQMKGRMSAPHEAARERGW
jgi:hypothetical protein